MSVTVIALVTINEKEPAALAEYFSVTQPLLDQAGAKIVKRFNINRVVVGSRPAQTVLFVEYPNLAAVESVFHSAEYKSIHHIRDRAFLDYSVTVGSDLDHAEDLVAVE